MNIVWLEQKEKTKMAWQITDANVEAAAAIDVGINDTNNKNNYSRIYILYAIMNTDKPIIELRK